MGNKTAIEWTEATWNPTVGCDRFSPGCARCYAKELHDRRHKALLAGKPMARQYAQPFEVLQMIESRLDVPLRTRKPTMFFVNSVSDLFHEDVPFDFIDRVFAVMAMAPQHTFQILTKRAERMRAYMTTPDRASRWNDAADKLDVVESVFERIAERARSEGDLVQEGTLLYRECDSATDSGTKPLPNVWLGVSVENQRWADERIPLLFQAPAAVRFISAEPLLGPMDLTGLDAWVFGLDWVIVGGESGRGARPFDVAWARSIVQQCQAAGVPVFVKQLGAQPFEERTDSFHHERNEPGLRVSFSVEGMTVKRTIPLRDRKGGTPDEWPVDLRVREFPRW